MLLFLSKYPRNTEENADGMLKRVEQIDGLISDYDRVYLYFELRRYWKPSVKKDKNRTDIRINYIWLLFYIKYFLAAKIIYLHSIYAIKKALPILMLPKKFILDIHGAVPEENKFLDRNWLSVLFLSIVESLVVNKASCIIGVTNKMINHIKHKHKVPDINSIVLPMSTLGNPARLGNQTRDIDIIYAGGHVKWQNIERLAVLCNKYPKLNSRLFINGYEQVIDMFDKKDNISLVTHDKLLQYLLRAKTGYIVRDPHILNSVSCPTKLIEYIQSGVVPIVDFDDLGDFKEMGYAYFMYDKILKDGFPDDLLIKQKSEHNFEVLEELIFIIQSGSTKLKDYIRLCCN